MRRIGILGDIGSGKSYAANNFGYPVFNADKEVGKIYKKDKKVFLKLKKILPKNSQINGENTFHMLPNGKIYLHKHSICIAQMQNFSFHMTTQCAVLF